MTIATTWHDDNSSPLEYRFKDEWLPVNSGTATRIGRMLWQHNWYGAGINLDDERDRPTGAEWDVANYVFEPLPGQDQPLLALQAIRCYSYQTGDLEDWKESEAYFFIEALHSCVIERLLSGHDLPWVIRQRDIFNR